MNLFRLISVLEGLSLVTLLFVAMPLRTYAGLPEAVTYAGWIHGILYLVYGAAGLLVCHFWKWSVGYWVVILLIGVIPFGFLYLENRLKQVGHLVHEAPDH